MPIYRDGFLDRIVRINFPAGDRWAYMSIRLHAVWSESTTPPAAPPTLPGNGMDFPKLPVTSVDPNRCILLQKGTQTDSASPVTSVMSSSSDRTDVFAIKPDTTLRELMTVEFDAPCGDNDGNDIDGAEYAQYSYEIKFLTSSKERNPTYADPTIPPQFLKSTRPVAPLSYTQWQEWISPFNDFSPTSDYFAQGVVTTDPNIDIDFPWRTGSPTGVHHLYFKVVDAAPTENKAWVMEDAQDPNIWEWVLYYA